jgi:hypothetical protein
MEAPSSLVAAAAIIGTRGITVAQVVFMGQAVAFMEDRTVVVAFMVEVSTAEVSMAVAHIIKTKDSGDYASHRQKRYYIIGGLQAFLWPYVGHTGSMRCQFCYG